MLGHADYEGGVALSTLIWSAIEDHEQDREEFWKSEGKERELKFVDGIAGAIVRASYQLTKPHPHEMPLTYEQCRQLVDIEGFRELALEKIEIEVAQEFTGETDKMAERCLDLTTEVVQHSPAEPVLRFLRRVTRCYVAGFSPEVIILCRAVLENAVLEKYEREQKPLPNVPAGKSEMSARLAKAEDYGWLSRRQREEAWTVWKRGSKAAHEDPTITAAALETVRITMSVLLQLYSTDGHAAKST